MKAIIQSHYPERRQNLNFMVQGLLDNGLKPSDIILLVDYTGYEFEATLQVIQSNKPMPITWWHGVAALLDTDYVALLCDDLILKPKSLNQLVKLANKTKEVGVWGFEGCKLAETDYPYSDSPSHLASKVEDVDIIIRFYFGRPEAFVNALKLFNQVPKEFRGHDDLLLSLSNSCALAPSTKDCGWTELPEYGVAVSKREDHYQKRDQLINFVKREIWNK